MPLETKHNLSQDTVEKLQDLIRINIDSEKGFSEAADEIEDATIASIFREIGQQRGQNVDELKEAVNWNGEEPVREGSYLAAFHRTWLDLRSKLSGGDAHVILSEAEKGEDHIKNAYEDVLKDTAGSAMNAALTKQYALVKQGHDRIRDMRDGYKK